MPNLRQQHYVLFIPHTSERLMADTVRIINMDASGEPPVQLWCTNRNSPERNHYADFYFHAGNSAPVLCLFLHPKLKFNCLRWFIKTAQSQSQIPSAERARTVVEEPFVNARYMKKMMAMGQASSCLSQLKVLKCMKTFSNLSGSMNFQWKTKAQLRLWYRTSPTSMLALENQSCNLFSIKWCRNLLSSDGLARFINSVMIFFFSFFLQEKYAQNGEIFSRTMRFERSSQEHKIEAWFLFQGKLSKVSSTPVCSNEMKNRKRIIPNRRDANGIPEGTPSKTLSHQRHRCYYCSLL